MGRLFKELKKGLEEIIAHKEGKLTLKSEFIEIPEPPKEYGPKKIKKIRAKWNYSQGIFAKVLNVSLKTVQAWESGVRNPNHAALRLLEIIDQGIYHPLIFKTASLKRVR
ncbi:MAG: helix-turn-helix domain-containing protein [Verrucomicrobia bacterium]|nr:helix-turn-helix domain-containing protein [Verrucomicrobiota bacterium]